MCGAALTAGVGSFGAAQQQQLFDAADDAVARKTDPGGDGPLSAGTLLPDLLSISLTPWDPSLGASYESGVKEVRTPPVPSDVLRIALTFKGLATPPGPLGLHGLPFEPFRYGASPVYGFVDFDIDNDINTGGEYGGPQLHRYLANVGRFGEVPKGLLAGRAAYEGTQLDGSFLSQPQVERSGTDFSLVLCGCFDLEIEDMYGDRDATFGAGDTWRIAGRFFQRAGGFEEASAAYGGSYFGQYDPIVRLTFSHDIPSDRTTVTLLFPLTMAGAATLANEPVEPIDLDVSNQVSVLEGLDDVIAGAQTPGLSKPAYTLCSGWYGRNPLNYLDPSSWRLTALVGTSYTVKDPAGALYVWTDVAGDHLCGDLNGDGVTDSADVSLWDSRLDERDGGFQDADGVSNGSVRIPKFGTNFSAFDINGDGFINIFDRALILPPLAGDANGDCAVGFPDITSALGFWGGAYAPSPSRGPGDANHDGAVSFPDIVCVLANFGSACP